jgi:hypothetical protein
MLPSDVISTIDRELPWVRNWQTELNKRGEFRFRALEIVPGLLRLVERVPDELLASLSSEDLARFVLAETALLEAIASARNSANSFDWPRLSDNTDCVAAIRSLLEKCPDQAPSESSRQLKFIKEEAFRVTLGVDLGSAERALNSGEWKAATILGGSIIEALLLWAIQQHTPPDIAAAIGRAAAAGKVSASLPANDLTARDWALHQYIEVAYELKEIKEHTANPCREAKYYRNLIHPAAAERDKEKCTRGKAHGVLGAVYSTIEDLEEKHT